MNQIQLLSSLAQKNDKRILLVVLDGLGGLDYDCRGTALDVAESPNLDELARVSSCGLFDPVAPGITPGSGPGHLSLFGYDPLEFEIGRGILSALGVAFPIEHGDLAARVNFASMDADGVITDRRAGRISTELCTRLCEKLSAKISLPGVEIFIRPEKEHRAAVVLRGKQLAAGLTDSDPQQVGLAPLDVQALDDDNEPAKATAELINNFITQAKEILADEQPANMILMRGFDQYHKIPSLNELYQLRSAAIASYPMYKGVSRLVGMDILGKSTTVEEQIGVLEESLRNYTYVYFHVKYTDSRGEDGDFEGRIKVLEEFDALLPRIRALQPDVLLVTGDHSTPAKMKAHSFHPVPVSLHSALARVDDVSKFSEKAFVTGELGHLRGTDLMPLALAHAEKLMKYGA